MSFAGKCLKILKLGFVILWTLETYVGYALFPICFLENPCTCSFHPAMILDVRDMFLLCTLLLISCLIQTVLSKSESFMRCWIDFLKYTIAKQVLFSWSTINKWRSLKLLQVPILVPTATGDAAIFVSSLQIREWRVPAQWDWSSSATEKPALSQRPFSCLPVTMTSNACPWKPITEFDLSQSKGSKPPWQ